MSKEKNFNDFVSYKNGKIVFCRDGRIFSIDKDTELVDLRDCENCKQKDQRISELEKENKRLNTKLEIWNRFDKKDYIHRGEKVTERDYYYYTNGVSVVLENEVERLKHDLAVRDKALELALISRKVMLEKQNCFTCSVEKAKIEFLEQAEEALRKFEGI